MLTIIIFILILGLLVFVHEFGHFVTAKKAGMKVYEFGLGMPPRAFGFYRDPITKKFVWVWGSKSQKSEVRSQPSSRAPFGSEPQGRRQAEGKSDTSLLNTAGGQETDEETQFPNTLYSLNWLPLGGFCKIKGENGELENAPDSFGFQKAWKKIIVLSAGVTMNFLLAGVLLGIGFMIGLPTDFSAGVDKSAIVVSEPKVMVQVVEKNSPAALAGIQYGDGIVSIDNVPMKGSEQMINYVKANSTKEMTVVVNRQGKETTVIMKPEVLKAGEVYARFGLALADAGIIRYPWYVSLYKGFVAAFFGLINIFIAFYYLIKNLIIGQGLLFDVSGPVGIAVLVGQSARLGISYLINITAMISLSLAAVNILPFPALDGGRILFILIAKIIRRPVPMKYEQLAHTIGFVLLMILIVVVTGRDILGLIK